MYSPRVRSGALLLALALATLACHGGAAPAPSAPEAGATEPAREPGSDLELSAEAREAAGLRVEPARVVPRVARVEAVGRLDFEPRRVARVGPLLDGRVRTLYVQPGEQVAAGAVLATVESVAVGQARAQVALAQAELRTRQAELERQRRLLTEGATSQREQRAAEASVTQARLTLAAAGEQLRAVGGEGSGGAGSRVGLSTPLAGTVLEVRARLGQTVAASDTLFVVGDTQRLWLLVDLYERDLGRVREGNAVRVRVPALGERSFTGRVDRLEGVVDPERHVGTARVELENRDGLLRPGMTALARIDALPDATDAGATALAVPASALVSIDGAPYVFVELREGHYALRAVERGPTLEEGVALERGLREGERVVVAGAFALKSELLREQMGAND